MYHRYFKLLLWCCVWGSCSMDENWKFFAIRSNKLAFSFVLVPFRNTQEFPGINVQQSVCTMIYSW